MQLSESIYNLTVKGWEKIVKRSGSATKNEMPLAFVGIYSVLRIYRGPMECVLDCGTIFLFYVYL